MDENYVQNFIFNSPNIFLKNLQNNHDTWSA